ncbi:hypothetical protein DPEC_G00372880, partial [Dallia pectoralis]
VWVQRSTRPVQGGPYGGGSAGSGGCATGDLHRAGNLLLSFAEASGSPHWKERDKEAAKVAG